MARSQWKGKRIFCKYVNSYFVSKPLLAVRDAMLLYSHKKESVFIPQLLGKNIWVYNGHEWFKIFVVIDILFQQFGKFVWPKKRCFFKKNKNKKKKK